MSAAATDPYARAAERWSAGRHLLGGLILAVGLGGGFVVWASQAMIAGAVIAHGQLRVDGKSKEVSHLEGGVVQEILVRNGDRVKAGQVLIRLDPTMARANVEIIDGQLDALMAQGARLEAEQIGAAAIVVSPDHAARVAARPQAAALLDGQRAVFEANRISVERQVSQLHEQVEQTREQITGFDAQRDALDVQIGLVAAELADRQRLLDQGYAPKTAVIELRQRKAELDGDRASAASHASEAGGRISEIELRILELEAERNRVAATDLREVQAQVNELREKRVGLEPTLRRMDIVAPQAGVVLNLEVNTVGGVISPGKPLLWIVPEDERLVLDTRIDAVSRDQVWIGQQARVKFPGFNQRTTPEVIGEVKSLGADAIADEHTGQRFYQAEIAIPPAELERLHAATRIDLAPGMPAEAYIETAERSAASYFLKPVRDSFARSMRED